MGLFRKTGTNWLGVPDDATRTDRNMDRDFGASSDSSPSAPSVRTTYDVFASYKGHEGANSAPASEFLAEVKELFGFADVTALVQGMLDRKEVTLATFEVDGEMLRPAADETIAAAKLASFLAAQGLKPPQDPVDPETVQKDLAEKDAKITEQGEEIARLTSENGDLRTERDGLLVEADGLKSDLEKAGADLTAAESTIDEAQQKIADLDAAKTTAETKLERVLLYVQKKHGEDIDPSKLDAKGEIVSDPDPKAPFEELIRALQTDPSNPQYAAMATMLSAMSGMLAPPAPVPPAPVPPAPAP